MDEFLPEIARGLIQISLFCEFTGLEDKSPALDEGAADAAKTEVVPHETVTESAVKESESKEAVSVQDGAAAEFGDRKATGKRKPTKQSNKAAAAASGALNLLLVAGSHV